MDLSFIKNSKIIFVLLAFIIFFPFPVWADPTVQGHEDAILVYFTATISNWNPYGYLSLSPGSNDAGDATILFEGTYEGAPVVYSDQECDLNSCLFDMGSDVSIQETHNVDAYYTGTSIEYTPFSFESPIFSGTDIGDAMFASFSSGNYCYDNSNNSNNPDNPDDPNNINYWKKPIQVSSLNYHGGSSVHRLSDEVCYDSVIDGGTYDLGSIELPTFSVEFSFSVGGELGDPNSIISVDIDDYAISTTQAPGSFLSVPNVNYSDLASFASNTSYFTYNSSIPEGSDPSFQLILPQGTIEDSLQGYVLPIEVRAIVNLDYVSTGLSYFIFPFLLLIGFAILFFVFFHKKFKIQEEEKEIFKKVE